jgi:hypothetical protein
VGTYDGAAVRLYVDGVEVGSGTPTNISINYFLPDNTNFYIGAYRAPGCNLGFLGDIDEVQLFNRALSAAEIQAVYQSTPGTTDYTDPVAFAAATHNPTTIGFNGILPLSMPFESFNPLIVSGVSFSTPISGVSVNVTKATYYSPNNYPADFIVDSSNPGANEQLTISLPHPFYALALSYGGLGFKGGGPGSATITLSNGHVFNVPALPTVGNTKFVGFVSTELFTSVTLATTNDDWVVESLILASP